MLKLGPSALQAGGQRFKSSIAHLKKPVFGLKMGFFLYFTTPLLPYYSFCAPTVHMSSDYLVGVESVVSGEIVCNGSVEVGRKSKGSGEMEFR